MTRLVILFVLSACILCIVAMTTNWLTYSGPALPKTIEPDWPPTVFVMQPSKTKQDSKPTKRVRRDIPDWLLALADLASTRRDITGNAQVTLSKPEPIGPAIYVEIFQNDTPCHGPEIDLARKVTQGIAARTPFNIAAERKSADSEVQGRLFIQEQKSKNAKSTKKASPPELLMLEFKWRDIRDGKLLAASHFVADDCGSMKKSHFMLLDDWALGEMAQRIVDVIVKAGGK